jgi:hypothetical protein
LKGEVFIVRISKIYFECEDNEEITILIKEMHNKNFQFTCSKVVNNFKGEK